MSDSWLLMGGVLSCSSREARGVKCSVRADARWVSLRARHEWKRCRRSNIHSPRIQPRLDIASRSWRPVRVGRRCQAPGDTDAGHGAARVHPASTVSIRGAASATVNSSRETLRCSAFVSSANNRCGAAIVYRCFSHSLSARPVRSRLVGQPLDHETGVDNDNISHRQSSNCFVRSLELRGSGRLSCGKHPVSQQLVAPCELTLKIEGLTLLFL